MRKNDRIGYQNINESMKEKSPYFNLYEKHEWIFIITGAR